MLVPSDIRVRMDSADGVQGRWSHLSPRHFTQWSGSKLHPSAGPSDDRHARVPSSACRTRAAIRRRSRHGRDL